MIPHHAKRFQYPWNLPVTVVRRITNPETFIDEERRFAAMGSEMLLSVTESCLRNLPQVREETATADVALQCVLVPEFWERLLPGTRDGLRRISTSLAEYDPAQSRLARLLSLKSQQRLQTQAAEMRHLIEHAAVLSLQALTEWTRFAISGSRAAKHHAPGDPVYEPAFTYRLVPAIIQRAIRFTQSDPA